MYLSHRFGQQVIAQWILAIAIVGSLVAGTATFITRNPGALNSSSADDTARTLPAVAPLDVVPGPYELYMTPGAPPSTLRNVMADVVPAAAERVSGPYELYMTQAPPMTAAQPVAPEAAPATEPVSGPCELYMTACAGLSSRR